MGKILIVMVALVVLVACGAVAYVALHHAAPAAPESAATVAANEPPVVPAQPEPAAPAEPAAPPSALAAAPAPVPATSAVAAEKGPLTREQLAALVDGLSPEDYAKLEKAAKKRERAKRMDDAKYALPSDRFLSSAKLNLTPDQEQKIKALKEAMKPQMDQALGEVRAQYTQWDARGQALWKSVSIEGQSDPAFQAQVKAESDKYNEIRQLQETITAPLDQQYLSQVNQVLSPDQQQTLNDSVAAAAQALAKQKQMWGGAVGDHLNGAMGGAKK